MSTDSITTHELSDLEQKYNSFYVPSFKISIGGQVQFSPAKGRVSSLTVRTAVEKANRVSFSVAGVYDQTDGGLTGLEQKGLETGNKLEVKVGYGDSTPTIMTGKITDVKPNFPAGSAPTVDVIGHDHRYFMDQKSNDKSWDDSTVKSVTESIASKYDFEGIDIGPRGPDPPDQPQKIKTLVKDAESDLSFLKGLIQKYNYEMFSSKGVLRFRPAVKMEENQIASVSLTYGKGLRSYRRTTGSDKSEVKKTKYKGTNPRTGETVSGSSERDKPEGADEKRLFKAPMESDTEAEDRANSKSNELDHSLRSTATTIGLPDLRIGEWFKIDGLGSIAGQTYDGKYYLQAVNHTINDSGYSTDLEMSGLIPEGSG